MVEAGVLSIKGTLDSSDVEKGARRINSSMDSVKQKTQSTTGSLAILAGVTAGVTAGFISIGAKGVGALSGLLAKSPQLADEFARMEVESFKLSSTLGNIFEPAFQDLVTGLSLFTQAVSNNESTIGSWVDAGMIIAKGALSDLNTVLETSILLWDKLDKLITPEDSETTYTQNLVKTGSEYLQNVKSEGLVPGTGRSLTQSMDTNVEIMANLLGAGLNNIFNLDIPMFDVHLLEEKWFGNVRNNTFYNTDTTGD